MANTRLVIDCTTGQTTEVPIDDAYIIAHRSKELELTISQSSLAVNASATLSAQLYTPPLTDNLRDALTDNLSISLQIGDVQQTVNLVNGAWSDTVSFVTAGSYKISCLSLPSNELTVEVS